MPQLLLVNQRNTLEVQDADDIQVLVNKEFQSPDLHLFECDHQ